jgi:hypothetical protein
MAYAAWTKGSAALLLAIEATAASLGVESLLHDEWARSQPDAPGRLAGAQAAAQTKAGRWAGEMREIAATFAAAGEPEGFHLAAADVYEARARGVARRSEQPPISEVAQAGPWATGLPAPQGRVPGDDRRPQAEGRSVAAAGARRHAAMARSARRGHTDISTFVQRQAAAYTAFLITDARAHAAAEVVNDIANALGPTGGSPSSA